MSNLIVWRDGPFTWAQAQSDGRTREQVRRAVEARELTRPLKGVYQKSSIPDTLVARCAALSLVMRPFDVVCDRTAAWLRGVDTLQEREIDAVPPIECVVLRHRSRSRHHVCAGGERDLQPRDVECLNGILVTTALRTALDLGCKRGAATALGVVDQFMRLCGVTKEQMYAELPRFKGRRGVIQLRQIIQLASALAESPGESWTRMRIVLAGLPEPVLQHWVYDRGVPVYRLDMAYVRAKVAVEFDGRDFHDSAEQRRHDEERRNWLRAHGWIVIVVRAEDLSAERSQVWLGQLRDALRGSLA